MKSLFVFPLFVSLAISDTCYYPDGTTTPGVYRCDNSTTGYSTCCEMGSICWSNGVCQKQTKGIIDWVRLGCTDPTWNDPACPSMCIGQAHSGGLGVRPCDGISGTNYCCDFVPDDAGNLTCCQTPKNVFSYRSATVLATVPFVSNSETATAAATSETSAVATTSETSSIASTSSTTSDAVTETSSRVAALTSAVTTRWTSASAASTSPETSTSSATNIGSASPTADSGSGLSSQAKTGVGIGVGVGIAGISGLAGLVFFLLRRRRTAGVEIPANAVQETKPEYSSQSSPQSQYSRVQGMQVGIFQPEMYEYQPRHHLHVSEIDTQRQIPAELYTRGVAHELGDR